MISGILNSFLTTFVSWPAPKGLKRNQQHLRGFLSKEPLREIRLQEDEQSWAPAFRVSNQCQSYVPIAKVQERPWTACSDSRELAKEKHLNTLPATVERHLSGGQEDTCELGDVFNVHVLLRSPCEVEVFFLGDKGNDLQAISSRSIFGLSIKGVDRSRLLL